MESWQIYRQYDFRVVNYDRKLFLRFKVLLSTLKYGFKSIPDILNVEVMVV